MVWAEHQSFVSDECVQPGAVETDADGRFRIDGRPPRRHRVMARSPRHEHAIARGVKAPAQDVRVMMQRAVTVRARLAPPAGEVLYAHSPKSPRRRPRGAPRDWRHGSALAVRDDVVVTGVPVGGAVLRLLVPGFQRIERDVVASPGETVDLGTIDLEPAIELCGRVLDSAGRPLVGTVVSIDHPFHGSETTPWDIHATTDDDGAFRLGGLWRGDVRLLVHTRRFLPPGFDVHVDGATPVTFAVPARTDDDAIADELERLR
jgi:hypothetical protein